MVSVRRVAPILLLAVTIPAWADEPQAAKTDTTQTAVQTTTAKTETMKTTKAAAPSTTSTAPASTSTAAPSTSTAPASTSTASATTSTATTTAPASTAAAPKKASSKKAASKSAKAAESGKKPAKKAVAKTAAKAAPKPTRPPRPLHKFGDHWTPYSPPDPSTYPAGAKTYTIKQGDTLWALAKQFYNNAYLWPQLWEANTWVTDAHWIYPGDVLLVTGEVVQQAQEGAAATGAATGAGTTAPTPTGLPTGLGAPAQRPLITAADAVGGTTSPVPLATDADVYCFGYLGQTNEPFPNRVSAWEDTELRYQPGATINDIDGSEGDLAIIDGGSATGLNAGDTYLLVVPGDVIKNPKTHSVIGKSYEYRGQIKVLCADATKSRGLITQSCGEVPVGARLKPLPQIPIPLARIPALPAFCDPFSGKKTGLIVNAQGGVWLDDLGEGKLVQIDLGNDDQVGPGGFLTVFREGIPGVTPRQVLGELAVLTAENHTATARIVLMRYPMRVGDFVEIR